jgi:phospholipid/cholesterol/gamma-HCH transport system substrate-binding protein
VTRAIRKHLRDFVAIIALFALAVGVVGYILAHQRVRFPLIEEPAFEIKAEFSNAQAVVPGQGQTVRVAGMRVGDVGKVELEDGRAVVTLQLDPEHDKLVREDATLLLRPRTGLKDMFVELDPGSKKAPAVEEGGTLPERNTAPDVNPDEILAALDHDARAYLRLLITGAGKGLYKRGDDLREVLRRLGPLHRDLARLNGEVKKRRTNLARLVHNYGSTVSELSKRDKELTTLVDSARASFEKLAAEDQNISTAVSRLPGTLSQLESTLVKVDELGDTMGPAFDSLRPAIRKLPEANEQVLPFAREAEPLIRQRIRPFVREARPYVKDVRPAARNLKTASPDLRESFHELNRFFNMLAHNPGGREKLPENLAEARKRDEGYLFWLGWVSQNSVSLFNTGDASGPFRRFIVSATCSTIRALDQQDALNTALYGFTNVLADPGLCGTG